MIRILYIHHGGGLGGAPLSLLFLLQQLDRERYQPIIVTFGDGPVVDLYRQEGIETRVVSGVTQFSHTTLEWYGGRKYWWMLPGKLLQFGPSVRRLRAVIRDIQPDIIHLNSSTMAPAAIAAYREGVPVVWHIREPLSKGYFGLRRRWLRGLIDRAERVVAISEYDASQLTPSDRIHVIHNFVDFDTFDKDIDGSPVRQELGIAPDAPVLLMLGGVSEPKGTLTLIRALPALVEALPDVRVIVAGPPLSTQPDTGLKALIKKLLRTDAYREACDNTLQSFPATIREAIIFTGYRQDIPALLAASDCLVFPSSVPHFARPVIEAAAMGKPSVASDLGGPQELIANGDSGVLVPADNPRELAAGVLRILQQSELREHMGRAAYQRARQYFDAERNAARTIHLYAEIHHSDG